MSEPFLAEVRMVGFNFAPRGWAFCDGQILPINQNQSLYSLLGTTYGGDGRTSFALPDLRGRTPVHPGNARGHSVALGQKGGSETVELNASQIPSHGHTLNGTTAAAQDRTGSGDILSNANTFAYGPASSLVSLAADNLSHTGGGQAHNNMQPSLVVNFCIALQGIFPSRN